MLLSKQATTVDLFFTRGCHFFIDILYISLRFFHLSKLTIRKNSKIFNLFKQTPRDILLLLHDIAGLNMYLEE